MSANELRGALRVLIQEARFKRTGPTPRSDGEIGAYTWAEKRLASTNAHTIVIEATAGAESIQGIRKDLFAPALEYLEGMRRGLSLVAAKAIIAEDELPGDLL